MIKEYMTYFNNTCIDCWTSGHVVWETQHQLDWVDFWVPLKCKNTHNIYKGNCPDHLYKLLPLCSRKRALAVVGDLKDKWSFFQFSENSILQTLKTWNTQLNWNDNSGSSVSAFLIILAQIPITGMCQISLLVQVCL